MKNAARHSVNTARIISRCFLILSGMNKVPSNTVSGIRITVVIPAVMSEDDIFLTAAGG